jgi:hypothetical protein
MKLSQCGNVFQTSKLPLGLMIGTLLDEATLRKVGRPFVSYEVVFYDRIKKEGVSCLDKGVRSWPESHEPQPI